MVFVIFSLLIIVFYQISFAKKDSFFYDNYSTKYSNSIKGICASLIVMTHLSQTVENLGRLSFLGKLGYLWVGIFFFYSGYGLMTSHMNKEEYLDGFFLKRLPSLLIPVYSSAFLYLVFNILAGSNYSIINLVISYVRFDLTVSFSWYVLVLLIFYIAFYVCFKFFSGDTSVLAISLFSILYLILGFILKIDNVYYKSSFPFLFGILFAWKYIQFINFIEKAYLKKVVIAITLFGLTFSSSLLLNLLFAITMNSTLKGVLTSSTLVILYVVLAMKVRIFNDVSNFLGNISFEMYLIHGFVLQLFKNGIFYIKNDFIYLILVALSTIVISYYLNLLNKKLVNIFSIYILKNTNTEVRKYGISK